MFDMKRAMEVEPRLRVDDRSGHRSLSSSQGYTVTNTSPNLCPAWKPGCGDAESNQVERVRPDHRGGRGASTKACCVRQVLCKF